MNIRRYADNAPPLEPHDVRTHLVGGVLKAEVEAKHKELIAAFKRWWKRQQERLTGLPQTRDLMVIRGELLTSF